MKQTAADIASAARLSIKTTREIISSGSPRVSVATSGSARSSVVASARNLATGSVETSLSSIGFGLASSIAGKGARTPDLFLDSIEVSFGSLGTLDASSCILTMTTDQETKSELISIKIFRAEIGQAPGTRSPNGSGLSSLLPRSSSRKNADPLWRISTALSSSLPHLSTIVKDDKTIPFRSAIGGSNDLRARRPKQNDRTVGQANLLTIDGVDTNVLSDPNFFLNRKLLGRAPVDELPSTVVVGASMISPGSAQTVPSQKQQNIDQHTLSFKEIGSISVSSIRSRVISDLAELTFIDSTTLYGRRYAYYAVATDKNLRVSNRTKIVTVDVIKSSVSCSMTTGSFIVVDNSIRFMLSSAGADRFEVFAKGAQKRDSVRLLSRESSLAIDSESSIGQNGFSLIGEVAANHSGDSVFIDRSLPAGVDVSYRFYAVDGFGNKVQTPYESKVRLSDGTRQTMLAVPTITADTSEDGKFIVIDVSCDDPHVMWFKITRRDVSMRQKYFTSPNEPSSCLLTQRDVKRRPSTLSPHLVGPDAWNGIIKNDSGRAELVDRTVMIDHTYQYLVEGYDSMGNVAGPSFSDIIGVFMRSVAKPPTSPTASFDGVSVKITWNDDTVDVLPEEMLGSVSKLADSSVRTVYQVERRAQSDSWYALPAVDTTEFIDSIDSENGPELNKSYDYRVISMKQGIVSPYTAPVTVITDLVPDAPAGMTISMTPLEMKPVTTTVSWIDSGSKIDKWEIERALVNKFAAGRVGTIVDMSKLDFERIATVTRESSRGLASAIDSGGDERKFIDGNVDIENARYYRVRAVSQTGLTSGWTFRGVIPVEPTYDRKLSKTISADEKTTLTSKLVPMQHRGNLR